MTTAALSPSASASAPPGWRQALLILCGVVALVWPAMINGGAFFFPDTGTYLRSADAAVGELTGLRSVWSDRKDAVVAGVTGDPAVTSAAPPKPAAHAPRSAVDTPGKAVPAANHPILLGRSIYYGLAIYPAMIAWGSLGVALLQAALAMIALWIAVVAFGSPRERAPTHALIIAVALAALTSLPFFVSLIMPDLFAGVSILLCTAAVAGWSRLVTVERLILSALLMFCAMTHSSHVLLLLALTGVGAVMWLGFALVPGPVVALFGLAAVAGLAGEQLFVASVNHRLGVQPVRPPFLTARLIADGPGYAMLRARCPQVQLVACRYLNRMPADSDAFLWSPDPREGVWSAEPISVQIAMAREDRRFVVETLRFAAAPVAASTARAVAHQIGLTRLNIFNQAANAGSGLSSSLPEPLASEVRDSRYAHRTMPVAPTEWANRVAAALAALVAGLVAAGRILPASGRSLRVAAGFVLGAILLNAAITGALSKPHDRYNVRVLWALDVVAAALLINSVSRRQRIRP
ncbi:hypothetical protein ACFOON_11535 [Novosphingobium piscinae]|uniref:Uncharacterized protein n=1 Tax=Novosphingobium piscinae TaxID=1507448 RepID=A0A7X1FWA1_9SPHN|nr:hypothetical protein [Novosphingobium piscinae]MBC2668151.1 hypothetical protein [Novosphingobium piscinae]